MKCEEVKSFRTEFYDLIIFCMILFLQNLLCIRGKLYVFLYLKHLKPLN